MISEYLTPIRDLVKRLGDDALAVYCRHGNLSQDVIDGIEAEQTSRKRVRDEEDGGSDTESEDGASEEDDTEDEVEDDEVENEDEDA